jgi:hypothetical protein
MSAHNDLAYSATQRILNDLRANTASWSVHHLTSRVTRDAAFGPWPQPDATLRDPSTQRSLAIEFKPPGHGKREYVTGLGQCLTYLNSYDYALLIMPTISQDNFSIAEYLAQTVRAAPLASVPLGILAYEKDPATDLEAIERLRERSGEPLPVTPTRVGRFWGYWRDLSNYDLFRLLVLIDRKGTYAQAWKAFWRELKTGRARLWTGKLRNPYSPSSETAQRLNAKLSMRHAGLIDPVGRLTELGLELLQLGKVYEPNSVAFMDGLAGRVLVEARHIELIYWVAEVQPTLSKAARTNGDKFFDALDKRLIEEGMIRAPAGYAKPHYIRDEPKLWNKLGLVQRLSATRYFWPGEGLRFDWRRISGILAAA